MAISPEGGTPRARWASRYIEPALALGLSSLLSILASWPLLPWVWTVYPSPQNQPDLNGAILWSAHIARVLTEGGPLWRDAMLHHPLGQELTLRFWNLGVAVLQLPFFLSFEAIPAYNLSLLLLSTLNGIGGWVLGRAVGQTRAAGMAGAALLTCSPFCWGEFVHGRVEQGLLAFVALSLAGALVLLRAPRARSALLTGVFLGIVAQCYWFYGYFLTLILVPVGVVAALRGRWPQVRALAMAAGLALLVAAPGAVGVVAAVLQPGSAWERAAEHQAFLDVGFQSWVALPLRALVWPASAPRYLRVFLPYSLLATLGLGLLPLPRRARAFALLGWLGLVLALGERLSWSTSQPLVLGGAVLPLPFALLRDALPGFWRLLWPYRLVSLAVVAGAACAGAVIAAVGRWRWLGAVLLVVTALVEVRVAQRMCDDPTLWNQPQAIVVPDLFRDLSREPGAHPLLNLPFRGHSSSTRWLAYHRQPMTEGDGDLEDCLSSPAWLDWVEQHPALLALEQATRHPEEPIPLPPGMLADLRAIGVEWAVLTLGKPSVEPGRYHEFFGWPPDYQDSVVVAWHIAAVEER